VKIPTVCSSSGLGWRLTEKLPHHLLVLHGTQVTSMVLEKLTPPTPPPPRSPPHPPTQGKSTYSLYLYNFLRFYVAHEMKCPTPTKRIPTIQLNVPRVRFCSTLFCVLYSCPPRYVAIYEDTPPPPPSRKTIQPPHGNPQNTAHLPDILFCQFTLLTLPLRTRIHAP